MRIELYVTDETIAGELVGTFILTTSEPGLLR